jgi:hypothetical protein
MDTPAMPPDDEIQPVPAAALIKRVRQGAVPEITVTHAAELGGVSGVRWQQIERGRETRSGETKPSVPKPDTAAKMAYGVNQAAGRILITPERLEGEGQDAEAAAILAEMISQDASRPQPPALPQANGQPALSALPDDVAATAGEWRRYLLDVIREEVQHVEPEGWEATVWADTRLDRPDKRAMIAWSRW